MSEIAEHLVPNSMLLFNESFAATNEREGSKSLCRLFEHSEKGMTVFYVTHLYEFGRGIFNETNEGAIFLRAEQEAPDGTRTFKLVEGEPLQTSYGQDLYGKVFDVEDQDCWTNNEQLIRTRRVHARTALSCADSRRAVTSCSKSSNRFNSA